MANRRLSDYSVDEIRERIKDRLYRRLRFLYRKMAPSRLLLHRSYLLDSEWYVQQYPDVVEAGTTALKHYLRHGARENRDPGPFFSTVWYRSQYPDIASSNQNPLVHYLRIGEAEGRLTGPSFRRRRLESKTGPSRALTNRSDQQRAKVQRKLNGELSDFLGDGSRIDFRHQAQEGRKLLVSVVIVTWNKAEFTLATLKALLNAKGTNLEVILVDNGSTDETHKLFNQLVGAKIITNSTNLGFVRAVNQGAAKATGDFILLLNNDACPKPDAINKAAAYLATNLNVAGVGGRMILPSGLLQEAGSIIWNDGSCEGYLRNEPPEIGEAMFRREVDYCSAAFLMVRKEVWLELGGFDEKYSPAYYEEVDFCARVLTAGYRLVYLPDVVIDHFEFASTSGVSEASQMQITRRNIFIESQRDFLKSQQDVEKHALTQARSRSLKPKILIIDDQIPRVSAGQGFARIVRLVETLQNTGFTVTVAATAHVGSVQWPEIWQELGPDIECIPDLSPRTLEAFLSEREGSYQLLWVSRPHNLSYLREIQARRPKLLNTPIIYDAEALTTANRVSTDGQEISITELQENAQDETSLTDIAQAVVCVSPLDRSAFSALTNKPTFIATHSLPIRPTNNDFESRRGVLFFGALTNLKSPNVESLKWFINEVWPKLPAQFRSKNPLQIAGQILPSLAKEWAREDIKVLGLVPNLWELANQAKLFVAPTRRAQGVPIKVLEAASFGLPSVVTPVLAQQLQWTAQKQALVAHDPSDFAKAITYLSTDETTWSAIRTSALTSAAQFCDPQSFDQAVLDAINAVGVQLPRRQ